ADDEVPVVAYFQWNHWLDIQHILCTVSRVNPRVVVVLHGNADEAGDGVLGSLSQSIGIGCRFWRLVCAYLTSRRCNGRILRTERHCEQDEARQRQETSLEGKPRTAQHGLESFHVSNTSVDQQTDN